MRLHEQSSQQMVFDEQGNFHGYADRKAHYAQKVRCPVCDAVGPCRVNGKELLPRTVHFERAEAAL